MAHSTDDRPDRVPGAVLFDIDGTLVDSNYLHVHAWVQALADVGRPVDAWRVHRGIGMGSSLLLADLLDDDAARRPSGAAPARGERSARAVARAVHLRRHGG